MGQPRSGVRRARTGCLVCQPSSWEWPGGVPSPFVTAIKLLSISLVLGRGIDPEGTPPVGHRARETSVILRGSESQGHVGHTGLNERSFPENQAPRSGAPPHHTTPAAAPRRGDLHLLPLRDVSFPVPQAERSPEQLSAPRDVRRDRPARDAQLTQPGATSWLRKIESRRCHCRRDAIHVKGGQETCCRPSSPQHLRSIDARGPALFDNQGL